METHDQDSARVRPFLSTPLNIGGQNLAFVTEGSPVASPL